MPPCLPPAPADPTPEGTGGLRPAWAGPGSRLLGRYRLGPRLGQGGMGEVFDAWDTLLHRRVALKTLPVPRAPAILRIMREARLQARLSHPNVCRIYDVDASGPAPVIAMQRVHGPNLQQAAPRLAQAEVVEILAAVAMAVNAAHRLQLIHRDLKPSNILLEPDGMGGWNTYVADFGLAMELGSEDGDPHLVLGTPEYLAPELRRAGASAGPAVDIYALGVTLRTTLALGPAAAGLRPTLPGRLQTLIDRCLEPRPQDRYPSAGELAEDLRRFRDGEPLLAERGAWRRGLGRALRRHPAWTAALGLVLLLGTGGLAWSRALAARAHRQAALAEHFTGSARNLEHQLRVERLIPAHDLRPAADRLRADLDRIQAELAQLGPGARGPGQLALGRGYCSLGDLPRARRALEAAWSGYRTPDVAYARFRLAGEEVSALAGRAELEDLESPLETAAAESLQEARRHFALARGQTWEPADLAEARLGNLEGRHARAVQHAQAAFTGRPWLYEAKVEEALALTALGQARQTEGAFRAAHSLYREASQAAQAARAIGRSDGACCLADLGWRLRWLQHPALDASERLALLDEAERLADHLGILEPDTPRALCARACVRIRRAATLARQGLDPDPELRRAERLLAPAAQRPEFQRMVARKRLQIQAVRRSGNVR